MAPRARRPPDGTNRKPLTVPSPPPSSSVAETSVPESASAAPRRVFVYGTLKRGLSNHHYLLGQRFVDEARTQPVYRLYDLGGYPGMVEVSRDGLSVEGEIWEIDETSLRRLDELEDIDGGEYARVFVKLAPPNDRERIEGYLYRRLQSLKRCRDIGANWSAAAPFTRDDRH